MEIVTVAVIYPLLLGLAAVVISKLVWKLKLLV